MAVKRITNKKHNRKITRKVRDGLKGLVKTQRGGYGRSAIHGSPASLATYRTNTLGRTRMIQPTRQLTRQPSMFQKFGSYVKNKLTKNKYSSHA